MADNNEQRHDECAVEESNAAKRIRVLGDTEERDESPLTINKWDNFWYHHKAKFWITAFFVFVLGVAVIQFATRVNPDVSVIYAGPDYITANMNRAFCDVLEGMAADYDKDGDVYVQLNDMVFMTPEQITAFEEKMEEMGEEGTVDRIANMQTLERFTYEIFGGEASICILGEDQYEMVKAEGGFMKLNTLLDTTPQGAIDDYGVRLRDTKLYTFYDAAKIFPEDAVLAIRTVSTMSALTGKEKAARLHERSCDLFVRMLTWDYPEGYTPPAETTAEVPAA